MSEIVQCNNIGSCGYGIKNKLIVYPLFQAQYDFIKELEKENITKGNTILDLQSMVNDLEKENAELKDSVSELSAALKEACEIDGEICDRFKMIYLSLANDTMKN